jgi:hypothetical protein
MIDVFARQIVGRRAWNSLKTDLELDAEDEMKMQRQQRHTTSEPGFTPAPIGLLQRRCSCSNHTVAGGGCTGCAKQKGGFQRTLAIGATHDPLEREADQFADRVMVASASAAVHGAPLRIQRYSGQAKGQMDAAPASVERTLAGSGRPLDPVLQQDMGQRFGYDFSQVRVHTGMEAERSAREVNAHAYTVGRNIVFGAGQFAPRTNVGRRLIAHELTHVAQQSEIGASLQCAPDKNADAAAPSTDPICVSFDLTAFQATMDGQVKDYKVSKDRLPLIRSLKMLRRCANSAELQQVRTKLETELGATDAQTIWDESGTAFGGYTGFYPGFAPDIKGHLTKLGASETLSAGTFELSASGSTHRSRARAKGKVEVADLARTDIVYFRGHQYAQYRAPGLFADGNETTGFDLRYVEKVGGFANVKLMISTSCATLCKEALDVFTSLFPNAAILGYRKSAPINGAAVRDDFRDRINALTRPLLLDQPVDIGTVISTWKAVIESKHSGQTSPLPGYYQGGDVHYWDGASWQSIAKADSGNKCKSKGDFSGHYPAPV